MKIKIFIFQSPFLNTDSIFGTMNQVTEYITKSLSETYIFSTNNVEMVAGDDDSYFTVFAEKFPDDPCGLYQKMEYGRILVKDIETED